MAQPQSYDNVPVLTGLRFVAAFCVLIAHAVSTILLFAETPLGPVYWLRQASGFGMTLFFVLSGFVIHYNYAGLVSRGGVWRYLWARFARLYPLLCLMLPIYILLSSKARNLWLGQVDGFDAQLTALPYFLVSLQSWLYAPVKGDGLVAAVGGGSPLTWSISTEWFFYIAYILLAVPILRLRRPVAIVAAILVWCMLWSGLASALHDRTPTLDAWAIGKFGPVAGLERDPQDSFVRWLLYMSPYVRIGEFVLGCLMAQLHTSLLRRTPSRIETRIAGSVLSLAVLSLPVIIWLMYAPAPPTDFFVKLNMNFGLAPSVALIVFCTTRYGGILSRLLSTRTCQVLGEASYSIYLIHYVVLLLVVRLSAPLSPDIPIDLLIGLARMAASLVAIGLMALALQAWFEAPCRRWLRGLAAPGAGRPGLAMLLVAMPVVLTLMIASLRPVLVAALTTRG